MRFENDSLERNNKHAAGTLTFSPDGKSLATVSLVHVARWDVAIGMQTWQGFTPHRRLERIAWSPDGRTIAACGVPGQVVLIDANSGKLTAALPDIGHEINCLAYSFDGRTIVTGGDDYAAHAWDVRRKEMIARAQLDPRGALNGQAVNAVVLRDMDRQVMLGTSSGNIYAWQPKSNAQQLLVERGHRDQIHSLALTPDEKILISFGRDRIVRLWDAETAIGWASKAFQKNSQKLLNSPKSCFSTVPRFDSRTHEKIMTPVPRGFARLLATRDSRTSSSCIWTSCESVSEMMI